MPATTFAELFGAVFPLPADVESGVEYTDGVTTFTGTLIVSGGSGGNVITIEGADATDYFDGIVAAIIAAVGQGTGDGPHAVDVTVDNDLGQLVPQARVRLKSTTNEYVGTTGLAGPELGLLTFNVVPGVYAVSVVAGSHSYSGTTITVTDSDALLEIEMTKFVLPSSDPGFVTGCWECFVDGSTSEGVEVSLRFARFDRSDIGKHHSKAVRKILSDASGQACFSNMFPGATYEVWTKSEQLRSVVTVPKTATGTIQLGSFSD